MERQQGILLLLCLVVAEEGLEEMKEEVQVKGAGVLVKRICIKKKELNGRNTRMDRETGQDRQGGGVWRFFHFR